MDESIIRCPKCKASIKLTDAVAAPLLESARAQFETDLAAARRQIATEERAAAIIAAQKNLEAERIAAEQAAAEAGRLRTDLQQLTAKLAAAQMEQARLLAKEHSLDEARREMDLTIAQQVNAAAATIREQARQAAESEIGLRVAEREEQIAAMARQIDDLKRRAEQGSTQLQGEAQELVLEQMLRLRFPLDTIEPVAKGVFGGDVVQRVLSPAGQAAGIILWESKRTKNWSDAWLPKLRGDQRAAKADIALLVTQAMPRLADGQMASEFDLIDGVWVTEWRCCLPVALALRQSLIEMAAVRAAAGGQKGKMELMYAYLTGPQFKHRVGAIVEQFAVMATDLAAERKAITRMWAKRETQIQTALDASAGMYGDLQGIAGSSMAEVEGLSLKQLT